MYLSISPDNLFNCAPNSFTSSESKASPLLGSSKYSRSSTCCSCAAPPTPVFPSSTTSSTPPPRPKPVPRLRALIGRGGTFDNSMEPKSEAPPWESKSSLLLPEPARLRSGEDIPSN